VTRDLLLILELLALRGGALGAKFALTLYLAHVIGLDVLGWYGLIVGGSLIAAVLIRGGILSGLLRKIPQWDEATVRAELGCYIAFAMLIYAALYAIAVGLAKLSAFDAFVGVLVLWIIHGEQWVADAIQVLYGIRRSRAAGWLGFAHTMVWPAAYAGLSLEYASWRTLDGLLIIWAAGCALTVGVLASIAYGQFPVPPVAKALAWGARRLAGSRLLYLQEVINIGRDHADRFLVSVLTSIELAGIYVFFLQFANAASALINAAAVFSERSALVAAAHRGRVVYEHAFKALCVRALGLMAGLLILIAAALDTLGHVFASAPILAHLGDGRWILVAGWMQMALTLGGLGLYARHFDRTRILATLSAAAVIPLFAILAVPAYGLTGMALSNIIASGVGIALIWAHDRVTASA
jgi:hypothetical protein